MTQNVDLVCRLGKIHLRKSALKKRIYEFNLFGKFARLHFQTLQTINHVFLALITHTHTHTHTERERKRRCCWLIAERGVRRLSVCSNTLRWILQGCKQTSSPALNSVQRRTTKAAPLPLYFSSSQVSWLGPWRLLSSPVPRWAPEYITIIKPSVI